MTLGLIHLGGEGGGGKKRNVNKAVKAKKKKNPQ
jgi:hypothetical protein